MSSSSGIKGSLRLESTRVFTRYLPANSTERVCSTFEPRLAISSISSQVIHSSRRERRGERERGSVRAAASERRNIVCVIHALKPGNHRNPARFKVAPHARAVDLNNARFTKGAVGFDRHLPASITACANAQCFQRQT